VVVCDLDLTLFAKSALLTKSCMRLYIRFQLKRFPHRRGILRFFCCIVSLLFFVQNKLLHNQSVFCCSRDALKN